MSDIDNHSVKFRGWRWFVTGCMRVIYRFWTRIAVHLFPENSQAERLALALHVPLPDTLNMNWVTDHLAVGGRVRPQDVKALARTGITHIVDTRSEYRDDRQLLEQEHIELLHLPTIDTHPLTIEQMQEGTSWVNERIKQGGRVLIHCEHGVGRSVLLTCAVLVSNGMGAQEALHLVQQKRWQAYPNDQQTDALRNFEKVLTVEHNT